MIPIISTAFVLGLVFKASPGPVFATSIKHGIQGGFRSAFSVQLGAILGDMIWAIIGLASMGLLIQLKIFQTPVYVLSLIYLLWLAFESWRAAKDNLLKDTSSSKVSDQSAIRSGMILAITNPQNIMYWAAIGSSLGAIGIGNPTVFQYTAFYFSFLTSTVIGGLIISALIHELHKRMNLRWARFIYYICSICFLLLAGLIIQKLYFNYSR